MLGSPHILAGVLLIGHSKKALTQTKFAELEEKLTS
jgi:hypothetical protein